MVRRWMEVEVCETDWLFNRRDQAEQVDLLVCETRVRVLMLLRRKWLRLLAQIIEPHGLPVGKRYVLV